MKYSESWLREWVNPSLSREELSNTLTMAGLEVEEMTPAADPFERVLIGEIFNVKKHPGAEHLWVCEVNIGKSNLLTIICGANNAKKGMKTAVAIVDATLPNKNKISAITIQGVASQGMLCSQQDLSLSEDNEGILELNSDAPLGQDLRTYLHLDDYIWNVSVTPNRGDCLSIKGLAREISILTKSSINEIAIPEMSPNIKDNLSVSITEKESCPRYVGRIIKNVKIEALTPVWMRERLRRSGIRSINPIVDVTNYVMLELGQPMHAFDLATLKGGIKVRKSKLGEKMMLLDGNDPELDDQTLVIADHEKPLAIAGVMGGLDSSVTLQTRDVFLESAYFSPKVVARQRQYYNLNSDSAYRFERGVDPAIQRQAIERATQLILDMAGGEIGPITEASDEKMLPRIVDGYLEEETITKILGISIPGKEVEEILNRLHFHKAKTNRKNEKGWEIQIPSYRFDISLDEDVVEEIIRLYGYNKIPTHVIKAELRAQLDTPLNLDKLREVLCCQDYNEIISYSFVDQKIQSLLDPDINGLKLINPISSDMGTLRSNLWAGLMNTLLYNKSRQQHRIRLFEIGNCFIPQGNTHIETLKLGGIVTGYASPEQWGMASREVDFYDLKGDVQNVLDFLDPHHKFVFKTAKHPALHPGQTAGIYYHNKEVGIIGALHPSIVQTLDLNEKVFVFELSLEAFKLPDSKTYNEISKFPEIRRDLALLVNETVPAEDIQDTIKKVAGDWLKDIFIFDVYQGKGVAPGLKSIALALILQHPTRTLVDKEIAELIERIISTLREKLGAVLRS